jgi:thiol-disulfide isomerase/thioredoxin
MWSRADTVIRSAGAGWITDPRRRGVQRWLAALALALPGLANGEVRVGEVFPAFGAAEVVPLAGSEIPSREGKVVLVDFWASWCAPCKASFPAMARLHAAYSARGLVIAAVSVDENASAAAAFVRRLSPPFATLHDRERKLVRQVSVPAMPTSYLLGRDGRVRFIHQGFHGAATEKEWRQQIEALLAGEEAAAAGSDN